MGELGADGLELQRLHILIEVRELGIKRMFLHDLIHIDEADFIGPGHGRSHAVGSRQLPGATRESEQERACERGLTAMRS
jgi:hypothetical protein